MLPWGKQVTGWTMAKITKRVVDALTPDPEGRDVFVWDGELRGFGIRLKSTGAGAYLIQYRTAEGNTRRKVIGKLGTLTPEEARKLARDDLASVSKGADPSTERKEARAVVTVSELCDLYLEAARAGLVMTRFGKAKRASTIAIDEGRIERHIKPTIGRHPVSKLTRAHLQKMVDAIAKGDTAGTFKTGPRGLARVSGGAGTAARVAEFFGGIWTWAERRGHVKGANPAHGLETGGRAAKDRTLNSDELKSLGTVLRAHADTHPAAVNALRLIALSGLRREEAVSLRWRELDLEGSCIRLEQSKTGRSLRAIGKKAVDHLKTLAGEAGDTKGEFVFPAARGNGAANLTKQIAALFDAAGLSDARSHDLRRTFASLADTEGYSDATIAELLGHARRGVTAVHYIRRPDAVLVAAADRVAARILAAMEAKPKNDEAGDKVTTLATGTKRRTRG